MQLNVFILGLDQSSSAYFTIQRKSLFCLILFKVPVLVDVVSYRW